MGTGAGGSPGAPSSAHSSPRSPRAARSASSSSTRSSCRRSTASSGLAPSAAAIGMQMRADHMGLSDEDVTYMGKDATHPLDTRMTNAKPEHNKGYVVDFGGSSSTEDQFFDLI